MAGFIEEMETKTGKVEEIITKYIPEQVGFQKTVIEAMNYSFLSGGKRLRPMIMLETFKMLGGESKVIEPFMAALEMIHTYSLIHDDLPCMDNDDYRRGRKTNHVVFGEAMAVLAGDALLNYAYETAAKAFELVDKNDVSEIQRVAKAMQILTTKAGIYGMVGGQCCDVEAEKKDLPITGEMLLFIHENKTAALIEAAFTIGAVLAGAHESTVSLLETSAKNIGIAFQIQDDILDVTSTLEELGKPVGSDEKNNKQTYITIFGMDKAKEDVEKLSKEAVENIKKADEKNQGQFLVELVLSLIDRRK